MKLIFIRHAEPDYSVDSLTEKGWREANLLAKRVASWPVSAAYVSPLGRAKDTAKPALAALGLEAAVCPWMREFYGLIRLPGSGRPSLPWDFMPSDWTQEPQLLDPFGWTQSPRYAHSLSPEQNTGRPDLSLLDTAGNAVAEQAERVFRGIDEILAAHGYVREGLYYRPEHSNEEVLVFFAHLGVIDVMLSHILNIAAPALWQGMYLAPSSVTVLGSEEREPGTAYFRVQSYGDTAHLLMGGEPVSPSGYFTETFSL